MPALIDLTGQKFGHLTAITRLDDRVTPSGARQPMWGCKCACGRRTVVEGRALRARRALSCRECVRDPSRMLKYGTTYLVYWPALGILKIGRSSRGARVEMMRQSGGVPILLAPGTDASWERAGLRRLRELFDPAFTGPSGEGAHRADRILVRGRGWSECFFVEPEDLQLAFDECLRTMLREGNTIGNNPPATPEWRRALTGILRARSARRRCGDSARAADARGAGERAAAAPAADRAPAVPCRRSAGRGGPGDPARSAARGGRDGVHLGAGRLGVAGDASGLARAVTGVHGPCHGPVVRPRTASAGTAIFIGWRERKNKRGRASESTCTHGRGGASATRPLGSLGGRLHPAGTYATQAPAHDGCSAHGMPGSPSRFAATLRTLRHSGQAVPGVDGSGAIHREARDVRGDDRRGDAR